MRRSFHIARAFLLFSLALGSNMAATQNFPDKPIRIIASQPGGDNDFSARIVAQGLAQRIGQPVNVENELGGSGGAEAVLKSPRDGYTLINVGSQFWIEPLLQKTPYETLKDFAPVIALSNVPFFLYVHPSVPASSARELIALARAKPGELRYGSGLPGASGHLATELFKSMAGVDLTRVEYKGGAAALNAVVTNEVQLIFASANSGAPLVRAGKLKALAAPNPRPSALIPGVPAIQESLPGYETRQVYGVLAAAGTPAPVIRQLNQEMARVMNSDEVKERFFKAGSEVMAGTSEEFTAFIKSETAKWARVIRDAGIRVQ